MAKFSGYLGYGVDIETAPSVFRKEITERKALGEIERNSRRLLEGETVNEDLTLQNTVTVTADAYAREHYFAILYVRWAGALWSVREVTVESPRLVLRLGGVYSGDKAETPDP